MSSQDTDSSAAQPATPANIKELFTSKPGASISCIARIIAIICTIFTVLPLIGSISACYLSAMQASMVVFSIRLAGRRKEKNISFFSRQFLNLLFSEDSGHYMLYCGFYYQYRPSVFILIPLAIHALLQATKFLYESKQVFSDRVQSIIGAAYTKVATNSESLLRFAASTEGFLMVIVTINAIFFSGALLAPFFHYYFLRWRYCSTRNKYVRVVFYEWRMGAQMLASHGSCPQFIRTVIYRVIDSLTYLAPSMQQSQQSTQ